MATYYLSDVEEHEGRICVCLSDDDRVRFSVESPVSNRGVVILVDRMSDGEVFIPLDALDSVITALTLAVKRSQASATETP
jgi:hypothetical protein